MENEPCLILVTFPNEQVARQIGTLLVERQAAACVNLLPRVSSIYRWQGNVETAEEVQAVIKTSSWAAGRVEALVAEHHPYDEPEILQVTVSGGSETFLTWLMESVAPS